jgi:hypothetical protein
MDSAHIISTMKIPYQQFSVNWHEGQIVVMDNNPATQQVQFEGTIQIYYFLEHEGF